MTLVAEMKEVRQVNFVEQGGSIHERSILALEPKNLEWRVADDSWMTFRANISLEKYEAGTRRYCVETLITFFVISCHIFHYSKAILPLFACSTFWVD